jgi:hypoxia up-regulated 1
MAAHLAKLFKEKTKKDLFTSPKAILKIYKEADRVKNILSANTDTTSQVEGLMDDVDFKAKVTREEFETMCADLFAQVKKPVLDAIKMAEISPVSSSQDIIIQFLYTSMY